MAPSFKHDPSDFLELVSLNQWVLFGQFFLMLLFIIKLALMFFRIPVLSTENVITLAGETEKSHLSLTEPACILVSLY
jgi:hypothetical protein